MGFTGSTNVSWIKTFFFGDRNLHMDGPMAKVGWNPAWKMPFKLQMILVNQNPFFGRHMKLVYVGMMYRLDRQIWWAWNQDTRNRTHGPGGTLQTASQTSVLLSLLAPSFRRILVKVFVWEPCLTGWCLINMKWKSALPRSFHIVWFATPFRGRFRHLPHARGFRLWRQLRSPVVQKSLLWFPGLLR